MLPAKKVPSIIICGFIPRASMLYFALQANVLTESAFILSPVNDAVLALVSLNIAIGAS